MTKKPLLVLDATKLGMADALALHKAGYELGAEWDAKIAEHYRICDFLFGRG